MSSPVQNLDPHAQELLQQYRSLLPVYTQMADIIPERLKEFLQIKKDFVISLNTTTRPQL